MVTGSCNFAFFPFLQQRDRLLSPQKPKIFILQLLKCLLILFPALDDV